MTQNRPQSGEYAPFFGEYVAVVPDGDILDVLENQLREMRLLLSPLSEKQAGFAYAHGKWSIKEVLGHINGAERIFSYRLLRIARCDQTPLSGFEQDDYVKSGNFTSRTLTGLLEEFTAVRRSTLALLRSLDGQAWPRHGVAKHN